MKRILALFLALLTLLSLAACGSDGDSSSVADSAESTLSQETYESADSSEVSVGFAESFDENGDPIKIEKSMLCDSIATVGGAAMGTSTCTTFVECSAGVAEGGRTGLTSLVTSICFALCLFISPIASIIPSAATAPALIYVGVLMLKNFAKVDMDDLSSAVPAFVTLVMMPMTYSISNGIGLGAISYTLIKVFTGKFQKKDIMVAIIAVLFALRFVFVTM